MAFKVHDSGPSNLTVHISSLFHYAVFGYICPKDIFPDALWFVQMQHCILLERRGFLLETFANEPYLFSLSHFNVVNI